MLLNLLRYLSNYKANYEKHYLLSFFPLFCFGQSANNQSSPIASHQVSPSEDLVDKSCELLHFHGTKSVVAKGVIDSVDPDSLIGSAPLGSDCWRVWITDLIDSSAPLYRPEIRGFDLQDAFIKGFSIAWPIKYIKICKYISFMIAQF